MTIIFTDMNKPFVKKLEKAVKGITNNLHKDIIFLNEDVLDVKSKYPEALIVTASNPKFTAGGGLDNILKNKYPEQWKNPREFKFTKDLFFVISCDSNIKTDKKIIQRALLGIYFASRNNDIIMTGIGTSIAGLDIEDFVNVFIDFYYADFREADFSRADFREADFREANFSKADFSTANFREANFREANFSKATFSKADLFDADFSEADFSEARFINANFREASFISADFSRADFVDADFREASFRSVDFGDAYFSKANFRRADFVDADFRWAYFIRADFREANFTDAIFNYRIIPEEGTMIGWKKCADDKIVKLEILNCKNAVGGLIGRKCRTNAVKVLKIFDCDGNECSTAISNYDSSFDYKVGQTILIDNWDKEPYLECKKGIHFFITRSEAEKY